LKGKLLSAALIVRNEERFIEDCLRSLVDRVDEIIIVDTGSTDRTLDIARDFGARIHHHPWTGDFSAARNASIEAAKSEWILYIDADERLVAFDRATLDALFTDPRYICHTVLFRPAVGFSRYREYRLFRKRPDLRFHGLIHESLVPALEALCSGGRLRIGHSPLALEHLGYEGDLRHKHLRNLPLLRARLALEPRHVYCWDQLGLTLQALGDEAGAESAWRQAIEVTRVDRGASLVNSLPYLHLADYLLERKRDAGAVLEEACRRFPENHTLTWLHARYFVEAGDHAAAIPLFSRLAATHASAIEDGPLAYDLSIFGAQAHAALGLCAFRLGRFAESAAHYASAETLAPGNLEFRAKRAVADARAK
jgi:glycosyltransferase involved in cell wall biosynthesis